MLKKVIIVLLLIISTAYWLLTRTNPPSPLTNEEKVVIDTLFSKTKPQCLGRFIFEVPESLDNALNKLTTINTMSISSKRMYYPAFKQRIELREEKLKSGLTVDPMDQPFLKQVYRTSENSIIFDRNENESVPGFGRILEGHLYANGVAFLVTQEITDYSDSRYEKDRALFLSDGSPAYTANNKSQKLAELQDLMSRLSGRKDDEIPTQPGTCIPQGFIRDNQYKNKEVIPMLYKNSDFFLGMETDNTYEKEPGLLARTAASGPLLIKSRARTLQRGKVQLTGMNAEEWLIKRDQVIYPENKYADSYLFHLYSNETIADYHHPVFSLELHNDGLDSPNYSDSQLVEIWNRITRTFRYRPGAF